MSIYAITVLGHDRPGIIAETTAALAELAANVEDSSMTLLRGHFAWTLLVQTQAPVGQVRERVSALFTDTEGLSTHVLELPQAQVPEGAAEQRDLIVSVHGTDRVGIVAHVAGTIAATGANITNLTTRLAGGLYLVVAEVTLPEGGSAAALSEELTRVGAELAVRITVQEVEADIF